MAFAWSAPSHYLNQCWDIVNWTLRNKLQWNINQNSYIFIQENAFERVISEMSAILSQPSCVKKGGNGGTGWPHICLQILSNALYIIFYGMYSKILTVCFPLQTPCLQQKSKLTEWTFNLCNHSFYIEYSIWCGTPGVSCMCSWLLFDVYQGIIFG